MNHKNTAAIIGIDVGGTKVNTGLVVNQQLKKVISAPVPADAAADDVLDFLRQQIDAVMQDNVVAIGIGVPSVVDVEQGIVYDTANIPSWKEVHLKAFLQQQFNVSVSVNNDVNCFVLGEKYFGKAQACHHVVGICLGTGIGAGVMLNGKLYSGQNGCAGELGNMPYRGGIVEDYSSGAFFKSHYHASGDELYERALQRDPIALQAFNEFGQHVGHALAMMLLSYDPEMIVIGGSIRRAEAFFSEAMMAVLKKLPYRSITRNLQITYSDNPYSAVLGATAL